MTATRVTSEALEVVEGGTGEGSRFTADALEVVGGGSRSTRVSSEAVEVLISNSARSRFTADVLEVVQPYAVALSLSTAVSKQIWPGGTPVLSGDVTVSGQQVEVTGLHGVPMVGTLGPNQIWVANPTATALVPADSGGSSLFSFYDPDKPPSSPDAASLVWSSGATPASATPINVGTSTYTVNTDANLLVLKPQNTSGWRGYVWAFPAGITGDFTMWSHVRINASAISYCLAGLILRSHNDTTSGRYINTYVGYNPDNGAGHFTNKLEYGGGYHNTFTGEIHVVRGYLNATDCIVAARRVGSNYFFETSVDGITISKSGAIGSTTIGGGSTFALNYFGLDFYCANQIAGEVTSSWGPVYITNSGTQQIGGKRTLAYT